MPFNPRQMSDDAWQLSSGLNCMSNDIGRLLSAFGKSRMRFVICQKAWGVGQMTRLQSRWEIGLCLKTSEPSLTVGLVPLAWSKELFAPAALSADGTSALPANRSLNVKGCSRLRS